MHSFVLYFYTKMQIFNKFHDNSHIFQNLITLFRFVLFRFVSFKDPYFTLEFGSEFSAKSSTKSNSGSEIFWDNLAYFCTINNTNDLFYQMLTIKIYDENHLRADTLIGSASISLKGLATSSLIGNNITFPLEIFCLKNKLVGEVTILCGLHKNKNIEKKELEIDSGFSRGVLHVNKIVGKEIQGGGLFSASIGDLTTYIVLSVPLSVPLSVTPSSPLSTPTPTPVPIPVPLAIPLSASILHTNDNSSSSLTTSSSMSPSPSLITNGVGLWTGKTGPKTGHTPVWDNLDFKPSVTRSVLNECVITAECWAKTLVGVGGDKSLGSGTVSIISAGACGGGWVCVRVCMYVCMYVCVYACMCVRL